MKNEELMRLAIDIAVDNVKNGGGPFGAVIARDGQVVATGVNRVTANNDPTAHAEVNAIRTACTKLGTFDLSGCVLYTSCEPCPMCLGAIYWAHIKTIYYAGTRSDAAKAGFDDDFIYREININPEKRSVPAFNFMPTEGAAVFKLWLDKEDRTNY